MNFEYFIAKRLIFQSKRSFSKLIVRLAVAAVALSLGVMLVSISVVKGFQGEITNKVIAFGSHIQISRAGYGKSFEQNPISLDSNKLNQIRKLPGVVHIQTTATKPGILKTGENIEGIVLKGVGADFDWSFMKDKLVKGDILHLPDSTLSGKIIISEKLAGRLRLDTGQKVVVYFVEYPTRVRKFRIGGIYNTGLEEVDKVFALCDLRHIQKLNGWKPHQAGTYEVLTKDFDVVSQVNREVSSKLGIYEDSRTVRQIFPQIFDWLNLLDVNVEIILTLMIIVAGINMITALLIMILERTRLIGLLKALGCSNLSIRKTFIYQAAFLIGAGLILGNILGLGFLFLQDTFEMFTLPQESYYLRVVPVSFRWGSFLLLNLGTMILCILAMLLPSIVTGRIMPVRALRFE